MLLRRVVFTQLILFLALFSRENSSFWQLSRIENLAAKSFVGSLTQQKEPVSWESLFKGEPFKVVYGGDPKHIGFHSQGVVRKYQQMWDSWTTRVKVPPKTIELFSAKSRFIIITEEENSNPVHILLSDVNNQSGIILGLQGYIADIPIKFVGMVWATPEDFSQALEDLLRVIQEKKIWVEKLYYPIFPNFLPEEVHTRDIGYIRHKIQGRLNTPFLKDNTYGCAIDQWGCLFHFGNIAGGFGFRPLETFRVEVSEVVEFSI